MFFIIDSLNLNIDKHKLRLAFSVLFDQLNDRHLWISLLYIVFTWMWVQATFLMKCSACTYFLSYRWNCSCEQDNLLNGSINDISLQISNNDDSLDGKFIIYLSTFLLSFVTFLLRLYWIFADISSDIIWNKYISCKQKLCLAMSGLKCNFRFQLMTTLCRPVSCLSMWLNLLPT